MKKIKIAFSDFWDGFEYNPKEKENYDNTFYRVLKSNFDLEIDYENPDFLIYSIFGNNHRNYNCKKIFYTGENLRPDFSYCDYAISFDYLDNPNHLRFPLSALTLHEKGITDFKKEIDFDLIKTKKTRFCNFVFSNPKGNERNFLFQELSKYKRIDSGGFVFNNMGQTVNDKLEFIDNYKFTIAFENSESPGYTTEKLVHPKLVNSIPIYWGNPKVGLDWNTSAFINYYDQGNFKNLIEFIKEIDNNDDLYYEMLMEPHYKEEKIPEDHKIENLINFFQSVLK